jgi:DNA-directed RNA polymerase specialized sigma24 family protein
VCITLTPAHTGLAAGAAFTAALPRVRAAARYVTRRVPCPDTREDLVAEAVALAWRYYLGLLRRGKDPGAFVTTLALRAAQAALAGRQLCGTEKAKDVLSPLAQLRGRVHVERLGERMIHRPARKPGDPVAEELVAADPRVNVPD